MEREAFGGEAHQNGPMPADLQVQISRVREGLAELDIKTRSIVRDHPVASVLGALALGWFAGRLLSKRW